MLLRLRPAAPEDAPAIGAVHHAAWAESSSSLVPRSVNARLTERERERQWRELLGKSETVAFVAELEGEIVGAVCAQPGDPAQLQALYVLPAHWGGGAAKQLHDAALAELAERGAKRVVLRVLSRNRRARRFYERESWDFEHVTMDDRGVEAAAYRRSL